MVVFYPFSPCVKTSSKPAKQNKRLNTLVLISVFRISASFRSGGVDAEQNNRCFCADLKNFNCTSFARERSPVSSLRAGTWIWLQWMQVVAIKISENRILNLASAHDGSRDHTAQISEPAVLHLFSNPKIFRVTLSSSVHSMHKTFYFIFPSSWDTHLK